MRYLTLFIALLAVGISSCHKNPLKPGGDPPGCSTFMPDSLTGRWAWLQTTDASGKVTESLATATYSRLYGFDGISSFQLVSAGDTTRSSYTTAMVAGDANSKGYTHTITIPAVATDAFYYTFSADTLHLISTSAQGATYTLVHTQQMW